ncbi:MAG: VWA domain-containing protein [Nitrospira sp. SB0667_bin_9]|nr:VWA domain-containing protein [Nitrospira sp. SB0667_bin_9]MYD30020.1 VWA domain-containing protein [Nitrospira sp. SB0661_bin_20]MYJ22347.1 VWA domain-containing protein [Nitrospira sp. SB0673_bin_12]
MDQSSFPETLRVRLEDRLNPDNALKVATALFNEGGAGHVSELLNELQERSAKLAGQAMDALPAMVERCGPEPVVSWLDVAVTFAGLSGAITLKYLKESPRLLGVLDSLALRQAVLETTLELADSDSEFAANCAFEFFRKAPELLLADSQTDLAQWAEIGRELTDWNDVLGIEFIRECPRVAEVLALEDVRPWVAFGMKLITQNSLGKPDYVGILEFFRTSPGLIGEIPDTDLHPQIVSVGSTLADQSPETALTFLAEAPSLMVLLPSMERRMKVIQYGGLLAERDAGVTMEYFRRAPDVIRLCDGTEGRDEAFETWFRGGMEVLDYSPDGACAYFALETSKALSEIEQATNIVLLRQVARSLKLLGHMICGQPVQVESLADSTQRPRLEMNAEGPTVYLPSIMNRFSSTEQNIRGYTVTLAHEVGHVEFGTYRIDLPFLRSLARRVVGRYQLEASISDIDGLTDFFDLYPQKGVIRDLWTILEDARVEFLLQQEYPGLRDDLAAVSRASVKTRSLLHGMTAREMVLDQLLLRFTQGADNSAVQDNLQQVVDRCWDVAQAIENPDATNEYAIELADRIYQVLDEMIGHLEAVVPRDADSTAEEEELGAGPRAAEETTGGYRGITNWAYRGEMNPDFVRGESTASDEGEDVEQQPEPELETAGGSSAPARRMQEPDTREARQDDAGEATSQRSVLEEYFHVKGAGDGVLPVPSGQEQTYVYPEWDGGIQDYRLKWCRVVERPGEEGGQNFVQQVLEQRAPAIRVLRRYFETMRPTGLQRVHGYDHGEHVDLDAAIRHVAERRAGIDPSDRIYDRRDKRERQVAVAFLVDMSGSTGRQLETGQRRVIDVEKEGLLLLVEALEVIGDQYAIYGFSGQGRHQVDFMVLKDFSDTRRYQTGQRIAAMTPLQQNRDGAAIRHAVQKLLRCPARHRLLVLLSDGRPLDGEYGEEYALEDTRMALREARQQGINPFCLTIDQQASGYLKRMYGDVQYLVLDNILTLPERLPRVYQRLTGRS